MLLALGGCGDPSVPVPPGNFGSEPEALEILCDKADTEPGHLYFYAEDVAPHGLIEVFTCTEQEAPFVPPVCIPTDQYSIDNDGVIRVLCGELNQNPADFVRIRKWVVAGSPWEGQLGSCLGSSGLVLGCMAF